MTIGGLTPDGRDGWTDFSRLVVEAALALDLKRPEMSFRWHPGIRTAVFLKGCPLRCIWCQNPESWKYEPEPIADGQKGEMRICGKSRSAEDVVEEVLRDRPFYANSGGGLTLSGGEPLAQAAFCEEILRRTHEVGVHAAIETSGYAPLKVIESVAPFVDLWLYDIKQLDAEKFLKFTSRPLESVLENLR